MGKLLILLLFALGVAQAQQPMSDSKENTEELFKVAYKGDRIAVQQLLSRAERGDAVAQYGVGVLYELGRSMLKDLTEAAAWYRKAADQGHIKAQNYLAAMYENGNGVPKDAEQAAFWYRKAAEQGDATAQNYLGSMYANGHGVPKDAAQSAFWYRKAAEHGGATAVPLPAQDSKIVPMLLDGGVYVVPVLVNNTITLNFIVDSGATDVSIPADVVTTLMRTGTITKSDFIGDRLYTLADGSTTSSPRFRIRSLKVGNIVLQDVIGSVANAKGELLLGQSFFGRFRSWSIDNAKHALVLE